MIMTISSRGGHEHANDALRTEPAAKSVAAKSAAKSPPFIVTVVLIVELLIMVAISIHVLTVQNDAVLYKTTLSQGKTSRAHHCNKQPLKGRNNCHKSLPSDCSSVRPVPHVGLR